MKKWRDIFSRNEKHAKKQRKIYVSNTFEEILLRLGVLKIDPDGDLNGYTAYLHELIREDLGRRLNQRRST